MRRRTISDSINGGGWALLLTGYAQTLANRAGENQGGEGRS
jgi:hypothetical protein